MAGRRGKHAELATQWGRWLHRLVRSACVNVSCVHKLLAGLEQKSLLRSDA